MPRRMAAPEREDAVDAAAETPAAGVAARSASGTDSGLARRRPPPGWPYYGGRAATGIGSSVRSEIRKVDMELERDPVAVVSIRYDFRPVVPPPVAIPHSGYRWPLVL